MDQPYGSPSPGRSLHRAWEASGEGVVETQTLWTKRGRGRQRCPGVCLRQGRRKASPRPQLRGYRTAFRDPHWPGVSARSSTPLPAPPPCALSNWAARHSPLHKGIVFPACSLQATTNIIPPRPGAENRLQPVCLYTKENQSETRKG